MHTLAFFVLSLGNLAAVFVAPRSKRSDIRDVLAIVLGIIAVLSPLCLTRDWPAFRTVAAFAVTAAFYRVVAIVRHPESTYAHRVFSILLPAVDARRVSSAPRVVRVGTFAAGALEFALATGFFLYARALPVAAPYAGVPSAERTLVGGLAAYLVVEGTARMLDELLACAGLDVGPLHDAPILARTVGEFWGRRWNRSVHALLRDDAFRPVASRAGVFAGVLAAFAASAVLHTVPILTAYGLVPALWMGAFFCIHGVIVVAESKLRVGRWRAPLGRMWTIAIFALTAPLFVEPMLRSMT